MFYVDVELIDLNLNPTNWNPVPNPVLNSDPFIQQVIVAGRSNNTLCHKKICDALPDIKIPEIHESVENCMIRMKENLSKEDNYPENIPKRARKA